jgi:hypothetical protein
VRFQSTNIHTAVQNSAKIKKKKLRKFRKKYAELVEGKKKLSSGITEYSYTLYPSLPEELVYYNIET